MKKYLILIIFLVTACSNIDKKAYYYNNSVKLNVVFNKNIETFGKGYLRINLWSENMELLDEKFIYDISHKFGNTHNKNILINFKNFDKNKNNIITVELFADTDKDELWENYMSTLKKAENKNEYTFDVR